MFSVSFFAFVSQVLEKKIKLGTGTPDDMLFTNFGADFLFSRSEIGLCNMFILHRYLMYNTLPSLWLYLRVANHTISIF